MKKKQTNKIVLGPEQRSAIEVWEQRTIELKCKLANLVIQQQIAAQDVVEAERAMIEKINEAARFHGIDAAEAKRWNFNTKTMTFTKLS